MSDLLLCFSILFGLLVLDILAQRFGADTRVEPNERWWRSDVWW